jgi:hypothetical protein
VREDARTFAGSWAQGSDCGTLRVEIPAAAAFLEKR